MIPQFELIGKKRTFKNVKMYAILDFQEKTQEILRNKDDNKDKDKPKKEKMDGKARMLEIGKLLGEFIEPWDPKEILEVQPQEWSLLQQLNLLYTFLHTRHSKEEITQFMEDIMSASAEGQIDFIRNPAAFQE